MTDQMEPAVDVTVVGGGPAGLAAAYYAGHRSCSVRIVESLEQLGGQCAALYPEKRILDVAGFPSIPAQELADRLAEQGLQFGADVQLGAEALTLGRRPAPEEPLGEQLVLGLADGRRLPTRTLILAAGHGAFEPRTLELPGIERWAGCGLQHFVRDTAALRGKRCVIVGGGDSALDWAADLQDVAAPPLQLVHRRDRFRGAESSVARAHALAEEGRLAIRTPCEIAAIEGVDRIEAVVVRNIESGATERVLCDALILQLGFVSRLGPLAEWGLELAGRDRVAVEPTTMETSLPNVFAVGDVADYERKITLITIGLGEAAIAANHCVARIRGTKAQPAYSTS